VASPQLRCVRRPVLVNPDEEEDSDMVVIGVDSHKRTHTVVAVDEAGRKLAERTVATTADGHLELLGWSRRWPERTWALEDCRHLTRRLEADLLKAGEAVRRVSTKLMAGARRSAREPGKSDPIDALSVARAALREPNLPTARLDGVERELRLMVDYRDVLITDRTRHQSRLRWFLVELASPNHRHAGSRSPSCSPASISNSSAGPSRVHGSLETSWPGSLS
jgi:transposase